MARRTLQREERVTVRGNQRNEMSHRGRQGGGGGERRTEWRTCATEIAIIRDLCGKCGALQHHMTFFEGIAALGPR